MLAAPIRWRERLFAAMVWAGNLGFPPLTSTPPASLCRRTVCMPSTPRFGLRPSTSTLDHTRRAVLNIGLRPTCSIPLLYCASRPILLDFQGDLYGQELEIIFGEKLRDEKNLARWRNCASRFFCDLQDAKTRF